MPSQSPQAQVVIPAQAAIAAAIAVAEAGPSDRWHAARAANRDVCHD